MLKGLDCQMKWAEMAQNAKGVVAQQNGLKWPKIP